MTTGPPRAEPGRDGSADAAGLPCRSARVYPAHVQPQGCDVPSQQAFDHVLGGAACEQRLDRDPRVAPERHPDGSDQPPRLERPANVVDRAVCRRATPPSRKVAPGPFGRAAVT